MVDINFKNQVFVCPFCGCKQSYSNSFESNQAGYGTHFVNRKEYSNEDLIVFHLRCTNKACSKITVVALTKATGEQFDLIPRHVHKEFPNYVPQQIRTDYVEAVSIIKYSPKAAATLLRRCLQGMIRDFWGIKKSNLKNEIDELQTRVTPSQWSAIDGLRKIGNIGAHMEKDIDLIIDIDEGEAEKLAQLIELLVDKWYVSRHDEEELYKSISDSASSKK